MEINDITNLVYDWVLEPGKRQAVIAAGSAALMLAATPLHIYFRARRNYLNQELHISEGTGKEEYINEKIKSIGVKSGATVVTSLVAGLAVAGYCFYEAATSGRMFSIDDPIIKYAAETGADIGSALFGSIIGTTLIDTINNLIVGKEVKYSGAIDEENKTIKDSED